MQMLNIENLRLSVNAYIECALDQDAGQDGGETLREMDFISEDFVNFRDEIASDIAAVIMKFQERLKNIDPETLGRIIWFERGYGDGTLEEGLDESLAEELKTFCVGLGTLDFWPCGPEDLQMERAEPFEGVWHGEESRNSSKREIKKRGLKM